VGGLGSTRVFFFYRAALAEPNLLVFDVWIDFVVPEGRVCGGAVCAERELVIVVSLVHDKRDIELAEV